MVLRPHDVLALRDDHFSGASALTEESGTQDGLVRALKAATERAPRTAVTASRALTADDEGCVLEVDPDGGTVDIDLSAGLAVGFIAEIRQVGTGTVTITAGAGATINVIASAAVPATIAEQWAGVSVEVRDEDTWLIDGRLA